LVGLSKDYLFGIGGAVSATGGECPEVGMLNSVWKAALCRSLKRAKSPWPSLGKSCNSRVAGAPGIAEDQVIMICVAMGFPDDDFPANAVVSLRKSVDDAAAFVGFDD
jgi:hypothetical protein